MKNFLRITLIACVLFLGSGLFAQTATWDGGGATNNWSEAANWVGDIPPADGDDIIFNGTSTKNCVIDVLTVITNNFSINAGYTGTIDGGGGDIFILGNFTQASGTFNSTMGTLYFYNETNSSNINVLKTGGSFNHNNGVVELNAAGNSTVTIVGTFTFNTLNLDFNQLSSSAQRTFVFGNTSRAAQMTISSSRTFGYQGTITITSALTINNTSTVTPTGSTATFSLNSGASPFTLSGPVLPGHCILPNITFNTSAVPVMSGNISLTGTWNNILSGNLAANGTSTVNFYGTSGAIVTNTLAPTTVNRRAKFHNLTIHSGATVTMGNRHWIEVSRNLTINGALNTTSQSGIHFDGVAGVTQNLGGSASGLTIGSILKSNATSTVSLGFALTVQDSIKFAGTSGRINTNGNILTLASSSALKARLSAIGNGSTNVSSIIGNVRVQTFALQGSTGWTNLGVSGVTGNTVGNWDGQFPMTCNGCTNGTTTAGGPFASIMHYNETLNGGNEYVTANASDALTPGRGLWVYLGTGQFTTTDILYTVNGAAVQGSVTIPLTNTPGSAYPGYNLVANPYPCPIRWTRVMATATNSNNLTNSIYIFNPDQGVTSAYNGVTNITSPAGSGANNVIPMGQGFYVEALSNTNLVFSEYSKTNANTGANQLLKSNSSFTPEPGDSLEPDPQPEVFDVGPYFRLAVNGFNGDYDDAVIHFHQNASDLFDKYDAHKVFQTPGYIGYPGPYNKYTTISTVMGNEEYSINSINPSPSAGYQIPVRVKVMQSGFYTIAPIDINVIPNNVCVSLFDKVLNVSHNLKNGSYNCYIADTTHSPRFELSICPMQVATGKIEASATENIFINKNNKGVYVDLKFPQTTNATISVTNILGQKLMNDKEVNTKEEQVYLDLNTTEQLIFVTVKTDKERVTKKFVNVN